MRLFEADRQHAEETQRFQEADSSRSEQIEKHASELQAARDLEEELRGKSKGLSELLQDTERRLEEASTRTRALQENSDKERGQATRHIGSLQRRIAHLEPFDERLYPMWGSMNSGPQHARSSRERVGVQRQLHDNSLQVGTHCCNMLRLWAKHFNVGSEEESAARLKVRLQLAKALEGLVSFVEELVPGLVQGLTLARAATLSQENRDGLGRLQKTHRKWVVCQSLLLMHDWSIGSVSRPVQETHQVHRLVDLLWRSHRIIRLLFVRLRLLPCVSTLATSRHSAQHFSLARDALRKNVDASGLCLDLEFTAGGSQASLAPFASLTEQVRQSVDELIINMESLGRCVTAWLSAQAGAQDKASQDGTLATELVESIHRLRASLSDRVIPSLSEVRHAGPVLFVCPTYRRASESQCGHGGKSGARVNGSSVAPSSSRPGYTERALGVLHRAPDSVGFEETQQMQILLRQLSVARSRLSREVGQQVKQLQALSNEKGVLSEQLRELQDNHALLRSNYQSLQNGVGAVGSKQQDTSDRASVQASPSKAEGSGSSGASDLVLSSRQRALMESLSVTAQESAALRQHGFFVDVISLTPGEIALAAGPPDADSIESWEMAVRKVYEQHARNLQVQVQAADGKAMKLHLSMADNMDVLREQEEEKQQLRNEVGFKNQQLENIAQDIALTRKNYDQQLAMLTEHICELSGRLSEKDAGLAALQAHKILCGHCATWNTMGKLLSPEAGGMCQTCKEKVLSHG